MPRDGRKHELVDGETRVTPADGRYGQVCVAMVPRLAGFVKEKRLGHAFDSSTGFRLPSGNVRSPDVSFVAAGRFAGPAPTGFSDVPPDLAVEVLSPEDSQRQVPDKHVLEREVSSHAEEQPLTPGEGHRSGPTAA
jgi:Uma2 family endonuclease